MQKIILFYQFTPLSDPEAVKLWQRILAESLDLKGRIIIANHGINGTLGGELTNLKKYISQTKSYPSFKAMVFKWSDGSETDFPRLSVKVRPELVAFHSPDKIVVDSQGIIGGGKRITPSKLHKLIQQKSDQVVLVDGRNAREAAIGKFKDAIVMNVNHTRDFPSEITKPQYQALKNKTVITYCTGGIRCEVLSKLMIDVGYKDVYQLDGGIVNYLNKYADDGLWEGSLFVFDKRMTLKSSPNTKVIGACQHCGASTDNYQNCSIKTCNELILVCSDCSHKLTTCTKCLNLSVTVSS